MKAKLEEVFAQVNTSQGWRYLDLAGQLMNLYEARFPELSLDGAELTMRTKTRESLWEIKVSGEKAWLHFSRPGTLTLAVDQSQQHLSEIFALFEIGAAKRFGLRSQWVIPVDDLQQAFGAIRRATVRDEVNTWMEGSLEGVGFEQRWNLQDGLGAVLRLNGAERNEAAAAQVPARVMLIDVDIYTGDPSGSLATAGWRKFARTATTLTTAVVDRTEKALRL